MVRAAVAILIVCSTAWGRVAQSNSRPETPFEYRLRQAIELAMRQEYQAAETSFLILAKEYPDHPAATLYWAGLLQARAEDFSELLPRRLFDSLLTATEQKARRYLERPESEAAGLMYLGSVLSYESFAASEAGEWFRAITRGLSGVSKLNQALARDSSLFDCYLGVGTYNYWKSRKTQILNWLPLVGDDRETGIRQLRLASSHGRHNRYLAGSSLASVCIDAGLYEEAVSVADAILKAFPGNRHYLQAKARAYEKWGRHEEALASYHALLEGIKTAQVPNPNREQLCHLKIAQQNQRLGRYELAMMHLKRMKAIRVEALPPHLRPGAEKRLDEGNALEFSIIQVVNGTK